MLYALVPIGRADGAEEASPIRKADDAATEKTRAEDVGSGNACNRTDICQRKIP